MSQPGLLYPHILDVQRHVDPYGASAAVHGQIQSFFHLIDRFLRVFQHDGVLGHRLYDADDIRLLGTVGTDSDPRMAGIFIQMIVAGNEDHGQIILIGAQTGRDCIGRGAARGYQTGGHALMDACIGHGRIGGTLLMVGGYRGNIPVFCHSVRQIKDPPARDEKDMGGSRLIYLSDDIICDSFHIY